MHSCKARHSRKPRPPSKETARTSLTHPACAQESFVCPFRTNSSKGVLSPLPCFLSSDTKPILCCRNTPCYYPFPLSLAFLDQKHPSPFRAPTLGSLPFTSHNFFLQSRHCSSHFPTHYHQPCTNHTPRTPQTRHIPLLCVKSLTNKQHNLITCFHWQNRNYR